MVDVCILYSTRMEIRDPIHGFIALNDTEQGIVDHPAFQRLRRIRQLAMADLVYPGAVHHRFEHSIGVCHVAARIADRLLSGDSDAIKYVRLAALVHDIGHGPFSHVSEEPLAEVNQKWLEESGTDADKIHEQIGLDILKHQILGSNKINEHEFREVSAILDTVKNKKTTIERGIVSGPVDADKMDYLLRDSLFCGVKYGMYDIDRLILSLMVISQGDERTVGICLDDVPVVDQFVIARYNMSLQVYGHKTRRATDLMLSRAILAAIGDDDDSIKGAYIYTPDDKDFTDRYLQFDDRSLMASLLASPSETAKKLANKLMHRDLPRRVWYRPVDQIEDDETKQKLLDKNMQGSETQRIKEEFEAEFAGSDPDTVFVEISNSKPVGKFNDLPEVDPEQIMVAGNNGHLTTLPTSKRLFPRLHLHEQSTPCSLFQHRGTGSRDTRPSTCKGQRGCAKDTPLAGQLNEQT